MAVIQLPHNGWVERPYQRKLWSYLQSGGKRAIEIAHRRWGKDDVMLHNTAIAAHERVGSYWSCLPEYAQGRKALWTAVNVHTGKRRIDEAFPHELRASTNDQEMFVRFKNGSTWQIVGSDRYNSLVGAGVAGVTFSEWALANPSSWGYIRPMLEENNGWAAFITTPRGRNHAHRMYERAKNSPNWFAEISSVHHTGALSPERLKEALDEYCDIYGPDLGQAQFDQEYGCSFNAAILGAFYAREMNAVRTSGRIVPLIAIPGRPVYRVWDIGVRDDTSIWWFQIVGGRIYILDCYTASGAGVEDYATEVDKRRTEHGWIDGNDYVPHDAKVKEWGSGRTRVESMVLCGLKPVLVPLAGKLDGINAVRKTLPLCLFHPRCEEVGIAALEQYRREWDDDKKCFKANEVHDWCFTGDTEVLVRVDNSSLTGYVTYPIKDMPNQGEVLTPCGWKPYHSPRLTRRNAPIVAVQFADGLTVRCTPDHMFMTVNGWKSAESLRKGLQIRSSLTRLRSISMVGSIAYSRAKRILRAVAKSCIEMFGWTHSAKSRPDVTSTTGMKTPRIIDSTILSAYLPQIIKPTLGTDDLSEARPSPDHLERRLAPQPNGIDLLKVDCGTRDMPNAQRDGSSGSERTNRANAVIPFLKRYFAKAAIAKSIAVWNANLLQVERVCVLDEAEDVYCITVPGEEAFSLANGAVVHNCSHLSDAFRYLAMAWRTIPAHIDISIPQPQAGQTMLPPAPEDMPGARGGRISLR